MKLRTRLELILAATLIVVAVLALFTNVFGRQLIPGLPMIRVQRVERFATSSITLESVRDLYELTTVRYVHRAVFPYDYLPSDASLNEILRKLRGSDRTVRETLSEEEYLYFRTWNLASEIDLSTSGGTFDFVVVTLIITAGFDVGSREEEIVVERYVAPDGSTARRATVTLPSPQIIEVAVEDIEREDYPYPDTSLGAEGWREVADYVREHSVPQPVIDEILETAKRNGEEFIRGALEQAGFAEVRFTGT
ncbi:MAG: hypothetical protein ACOCWX_03070 [Spirochaetota bacterium]